MSLGLSRDILFILRAKDEVSRTLTGIERSFGGLSGSLGQKLDAAGSAALGLGAGILAVGAAGIGLMATTTGAFEAYEKQAALTKTQIQGIPATIDEIMAATSRLASVGAPLKELQPALFDIFSSLNIKSMDEATGILGKFAKAGVAGGTDVQTAGRIAISTMNAWGLGSNDLGAILDSQFQLVRIGIGNYEEFAKSLGRSLPSARRAGADFNQLAGVMAYLTRNGLSTAQSATSAARAFDMLSNPVFASNLKNIGVAVGDSDGNFRNIADVVGDLREKFGGLSEVARSKALTDLFFKAGGNIQARRFWDIAVAGGGDLNGMMELMTHSSGALNEAYATMAATGATKTEIFKNKVALLKIDLGKLFEPIKQAALGKISEWIDKFNALDESTKKLIVKIVSIVTAIGTVGGTGLLLIGTFLKIGAAILSINPWLLLIAAAAFLIYKNWDKIRPYFEKYWAIIQVKVKEFVTWLKITWEKLWPVLLEHIKAFAAWVINTWQDLWPKIHDAAVTVFNAILTAWNYLWQNVPIWINTAWGIIQTVWNAMQTGWNFLWNVVVTGINAIKTAAAWFWNEFGPSIMQVWNSLVQNIPPLVQSIWETIQHLWDVIVTIFNAAWPIVVTVVQLFWDTLQRIFHVALNILTTFWENWGGHLWAFIKGIWDGITDVVSGAIQAVSGIIRLVLDIINGKWGKVWGDIKDIFGGIWDIILGVLKVAMAVLVGAFETAFDIVKTVIQVFWDTLKNLLGFIGDVFVAGFKIAWDILKGAVLSVWAVIEPPLQAFWNMLKKIWDIAGKVGEVVGGIFKAGGSLLGKIPGLATGGNYANGPFIAGENGPEIVFPNRGGGYVMNAARSNDLLNSNNGQSITIAPGAIQISMGSGYDMNAVENVVNESFEKLVRTLQVRGNR